MATTINTALQNRQADSVGDDLNSGFIDIYTGAQPAPNTAPTGTLLVSCALAADAYAAAVAGVAAKLGTIVGTAIAAGTAGYAQQRNAANTRWMYGSVTLTGGGGNVELDDIVIGIGDIVTITSSTITPTGFITMPIQWEADGTVESPPGLGMEFWSSGAPVGDSVNGGMALWVDGTPIEQEID